MSNIIRMTTAAVGLCGAGTILYHRCLARKPPLERNRDLLRLAAVALSSEVVDTVLVRDEQLQKLLRGFVKDVFLHPDVVQEIKAYVKEEFTNNEATVTALRKFIVEDIICDTWVADELISMVKEAGKEIVEDPAVHPGLTLRLIGSAAQEGLQTSTFKESLWQALRASLWLAFLGPPPEHLGVWRAK
ncbi:hypothetical protein DQ04_00271290 [Trypanosoma grayi]|uniref:hypothetical protein n=1 Tax=Trypanosoma grayi TaxID=71804 RepID=UPI0004F489B4|nr:hypothetical protein DQ04_00271290 [Trypanosoma grayi]KEG14895.1 hypothetical protein DQ04_00271290 [Trypanosoma grayi]